MKKSLRKIIIDQTEFMFLVSDKYDRETELNTLTVKVYVNGNKRTSLILRFLTMEHYYAGQPLKTGINLVHTPSDTTISVNLNEPKFIRQLIELGLKKGWNGQAQLEVKNGLDWLNELGYEVSELIEEVETSLELTERLKKFDYTKSWLDCGLLTLEILSEQEQLFNKGEDQNTEHYRFATCVHYLQSKKELSDLEFERYFMILQEDPNTYMAGSAVIEVFKWIRLTEKQFEVFPNRAIGFGDWMQKIIFREQLLHQLKTKSHDMEFINSCIQNGDSVVQRYLLKQCDLNQDQLEQLSVHGKNKQIRTVSKEKILKS